MRRFVSVDAVVSVCAVSADARAEGGEQQRGEPPGDRQGPAVAAAAHPPDDGGYGADAREQVARREAAGCIGRGPGVGRPREQGSISLHDILGCGKKYAANRPLATRLWNVFCTGGLVINSCSVMKKMLMLLVSAAAALSVSAAPQQVNFDKLPNSSQAFIRKNFPGETVKSVEMDREASWDKYTVYFNSGTQLSFEGGSGDCSEIIMKNGTVPADAIAPRLRSYVASQYPNTSIVFYQTTANGYRVGLPDKTFLDFDKNGNFIKATK